MRQDPYKRFAFFTMIGAAVWLGFLPLYELFFSWTQFVPGINWVYLPHGVRMMLVLLLGPAGALGFTLGAVVYTQLTGYGPTFDPLLDIVLAVVPGLAAWFAVMLTFRQWPGQSLQPLASLGTQAMDARRLLLLAFASAILNSTSHITVRYAFGSEVHDWLDLLMAMFIGDLFGALCLLYALKACILIFESSKLDSIHHDRKAEFKSR